MTDTLAYCDTEFIVTVTGLVSKDQVTLAKWEGKLQMTSSSKTISDYLLLILQTLFAFFTKQGT